MSAPERRAAIRVLLVDDNELDRDMLSRRLARRGAGQRRNGEDQRGAGVTQEAAAARAEFTVFTHCAPSGVSATASRRRPRPA